MDFDSCFGERRRAPNSTSLQCQRFKSPIEIQGQGDCKCSADFQRTTNFWTSSDNRKKFKEESGAELKPEDEKKFTDLHLGYFAKRDFPGKFKQERKVDDFDELWNSPYSSWTSKIETPSPQESLSRNQHSKTEDLAGNLLEFEKKVEFLYQLFKDWEQKPPIEDQSQKSVSKLSGEIFHFLDLNYRMTTVEESIGKLASILEELIKDPKKAKPPLFPEQSLLFSDPSNFEEMNMTQRMNYLKSKNDLLKSLIKAFFNAGTVDDICSRMSSLSNDYEFSQTSLHSSVDFEEKQHSKDLNLEEIIESLRKLRKKMADGQVKKSQNYEQHAAKSEKKEEHPLNLHGDNRLEVISEQAELAFGEDPKGDEFEEKKLIRNFKEKVSDVKEKPQENNYSIRDVTARLSAQEAELLNSSLKKVQFELFSSLDSTGKKFFKTNMNDLRVAGKEEPKSHLFDDESNDNSRLITTKYPKHDDYDELMKAGRNPPERSPKTLCKPIEEVKQINDQSECKNKLVRKTPQKSTFTMLPCYAKGRRTDFFPGEDRPPVREDCGTEPKEERQRPATEPRILRKPLSPLSLKPPVPDRPKKNSGINNVKNKNKILLSKKSFVQTP